MDAFAPATVEELAHEVTQSWPAELDHLSASSLKMFFKCPEQWRRRYVKGEKIPPAATLIQGRADHTAIEHNFREKIVTGDDVPVDDVAMIFAVEIDKEIEEAGGPGEVDFGAKVKGKTERRKAAAAMKDSGVELVKAYRVQQCPGFEPVAVEEAFELEVPGVPVKITGRLDLVGRPVQHFFGQSEPTRGPEVIRDRKTTGRAMKTPEMEWRVQGGIYMLHRWLPHEWHLSVKTKEPKIITPEVPEYEELVLKPSPLLHRQTTMQLRRLVLGIGFMYVTYGPDEPWDGAILHQWACGYCGYKPTCPWWRTDYQIAQNTKAPA